MGVRFFDLLMDWLLPKPASLETHGVTRRLSSLQSLEHLSRCPWAMSWGPVSPEGSGSLRPTHSCRDGLTPALHPPQSLA